MKISKLHSRIDTYQPRRKQHHACYPAAYLHPLVISTPNSHPRACQATTRFFTSAATTRFPSAVATTRLLAAEARLDAVQCTHPDSAFTSARSASIAATRHPQRTNADVLLFQEQELESERYQCSTNSTREADDTGMFDFR